MNTGVDEILVRRLPLPLARLYRLAYSARTPLEQHTYAFYLWEVALKLLGSVAVVECLAGEGPDAAIRERLARLSRPSLGHWWELIRRLVPKLAKCGDPNFTTVRDLLFGKTQQDLTRTAALAAALTEDHRSAPRKVRLSQLVNALLAYRNRELGHGVDRQRTNDFYVEMGRALLEGATELFGRLDVLAGRRLIYLARQHSPPAIDMAYDRLELVGEVPVPLGPLDLDTLETGYPLVASRLYLLTPEDGPAAPRLYCVSGWLPLTCVTRWFRSAGSDGAPTERSFQRYYDVRVFGRPAKPELVHRVLSQEAIAYFAKNRGWTTRAHGGYLLIWDDSESECDPKRRPDLVAKAVEIRRLLKQTTQVNPQTAEAMATSSTP